MDFWIILLYKKALLQGIVYGKSALLMGLCHTPKVYRPAQKTIVLPNPPTSQAEKAPIINLYLSLTIGKSTSLQLRVRRIPFVNTLPPPPKESERKTFPLALFSRSQTLLQKRTRRRGSGGGGKERGGREERGVSGSSYSSSFSFFPIPILLGDL